MHLIVTNVVFIALAAALAAQRSASSQAGGTETINFNKVMTLVGEMALEEKIAQITLVDRGLLEKESNIRYHAFRSSVTGGGSWRGDLR